MTDFRTIYNTQAILYDRLVAREDYQGNILRALKQIRPLAGLELVELGAGTGRLTRLLAPVVGRICSMDISGHMLSLARQQMTRSELRNWETAIADNRRLPVKSQCADIAIVGWSLGHFVGWYPDSWPQEIGLALAEMKRVLRFGGTLIILETQGTGQETPHPPAPGLSAYYQWLEQTHRFSTTWIRTDYRFDSPEEAKALLSFFFGGELAGRIMRPNTDIVPECTGIWWLTI